MSLLTTASQTVGPYVFIGFNDLVIDHIASQDVAGKRVVIGGHIRDGDDRPVGDAVVEVWQADADGIYASEVDVRNSSSAKFRGFGRALADKDGGFRFSTIRPGRVPGPDGVLQAPHLVVTIFMRGLLKQLMTRMYFPDEASNVDDLVLTTVPEDRRSTLVARASSAEPGTFVWDVALQGDNETAFFDY